MKKESKQFPKRKKQFFPDFKTVKKHFDAQHPIAVQISKSKTIIVNSLQLAMLADVESVKFLDVVNVGYPGKRISVFNTFHPHKMAARSYWKTELAPLLVSLKALHPENLHSINS